MLPPDRVNLGTDPLVDRGGVSLPVKTQPSVALAFRARSGCYLAVFSALVLMIIGGCSLLGKGIWEFSEFLTKGLPPLEWLSAGHIAIAVFFGLLLFLAFIVGFVLPPWRKTTK